MKSQSVIVVTDQPVQRNPQSIETNSCTIRAVFAGDIDEDKMSVRGLRATMVLIPETLIGMEMEKKVRIWADKATNGVVRFYQGDNNISKDYIRYY